MFAVIVYFMCDEVACSSVTKSESRSNEKNQNIFLRLLTTTIRQIKWLTRGSLDKTNRQLNKRDDRFQSGTAQGDHCRWNH